MPSYNTKKSAAPGIPGIPAVAKDFLSLSGDHTDFDSRLNLLIEQYPQFFQSLLNIINSDHFKLDTKVTSVHQAIALTSFERVSQLLLVQVIYLTFNQYKVHGLDNEAFWQDSLRRAVSARMIGSLIGLDGELCFNAGFIQDLGFFLLFLEQPEKAGLWREFHKREPEARLSMEQNVFNHQHDHQLKTFLQAWNVMSKIAVQLSSHHNCDDSDLSELDIQLCKVLNCADWMSAVYTAADKSHVINKCRKLMTEYFEMESYRAEQLLESIPDEVDFASLVLDIKTGEHAAFSKILYQANISLNEDNVNFQELTYRLEQALDERDRLAEEINRELNLAREIQQSLLPESRDDNYPVHGVNLSARSLSGDFYDFFEMENGDIYFNLGDVSGKGVNAALLMAKASSLFRCLGKRISEPGKLLYEINNELCETSIHGMFVTMVAGIYKPSNGQVKLVNAGNPPALLFTKNGICREFEATAPPLGIMKNTLYSEYEINLLDSSLYIYSDGVTEGYMNDNSTLELSGLFKLISNMHDGLTAKQRLSDILDKFTNTSQALRDDVTLLLLEDHQ